ncbi:MAG TPA: hypothetical protein VGN26_06190 [Armatimonadota bacterium]|jgi:hypothetical protein
MDANDNNDDLRPRVLFSYDEEMAQVALEFDSETNCVEVRAGLHGYAMLAELFGIYATMPKDAFGEHSHIDVQSASAGELVVTYSDRV